MHRFTTPSIALITALLASAFPVGTPLMAALPASPVRSSSDGGARSIMPCDCSHFPWPDGCVSQCRSTPRHTAKGTIESADATAKSFVIHTAKGADVTVKVNDKTKYGPKGRGWDDVKAGAKVAVIYHSAGTDNRATTVHIAPLAAAAAAKSTG
jgi:hypothetical protein